MRQPVIKKFLKMLNLRSIAFPVVFLLAALSATAQFQTVSTSGSGVKVFPLSEIKEGMRGTARSVFRGTEPEEFTVEILGIVPNYIGPRQDMIVGRLSGANAERTFVFAGMSGSPVYIDGKLVGAISYSFPFAKEPIAGITPFEQMVSVVEQGPARKAAAIGPRSFSYSELMSPNWLPDVNSRPVGAAVTGFGADSRLMSVAGQTFTPIATPITISGISKKTLDSLTPMFERAGLMPVSASGGDTELKPLKKATAATLLGGTSVVVHLSRGDIQIAAAGTVTLRDGNKIYAFGHPFFSLGSAELPMSESHVVTVVPNANNSFKLAVPDDLVGTMTQDRATGIYGMLGQSPRMLPVKIKLTTSRGRSEEVNFESAFDELLTPLIINAGIGNAISANERGIGDTTIELSGEITIKGEEPIRINRRFTGPQATALTAAAGAVPLSALLRANFDGLQITGVNLNLNAVDGSKTAVIDRISVDRTQVKAGETVEIVATARTESGKLMFEKIPFTIPVGTAPGQLAIAVGDGAAVSQNAAITQFTPRTATELISILNRLKRSDRLYAVATRASAGAIVGSSEMPNLPPSMLATLNNDRTAGGSKPSVSTIVYEIEIAPGEYIISGSQTLNIEVIR